MAIKKSLYHYTIINQNFYNNLINYTLWFTDPLSLNDPYDCQPPIIFGQQSSAYLMGEFYDALKSQNLENATLGMERGAFLSAWNRDAVGLEKRVQGELQKQINKEIGIYCLSTRPDSIQMWSYYASKHEGVVLEFNFHEFLVTDKVISSGGKVDNYYWKVNYPRKKTFLDFLRQGEPMTKNLFGQLITKAPEWKHEKEYRVIMPQAGLHAMNPKALTRIIFGMKTPPETAKTIVRLASSLKYPNLKNFAIAYPDEDQFKIKIKNLKLEKLLS